MPYNIFNFFTGSDDELLVDHKCDDDDDDDFRSLPGTRSHSRKASGDASSFNLTLGDQVMIRLDLSNVEYNKQMIKL